MKYPLLIFKPIKLNEFDWLDYLARYVFIFLMGFYFLGQFTQRRFKS